MHPGKNLKRLYNLNEYTCKTTEVHKLVKDILATGIPKYQTTIDYQKLPECVKKVEGLNQILIEFCVYYAIKMHPDTLTKENAITILDDRVGDKGQVSLLNIITNQSLVSICANILKDEYPELYAANLILCDDKTLLNVYTSKIPGITDKDHHIDFEIM